MEKVILRTCAYSRALKDRKSMFRVVKTPNHEIHIDPTYLAAGRGAYLSKDKDIIAKAKIRHILEKSFKVADCQNIYDEMINLLD